MSRLLALEDVAFSYAGESSWALKGAEMEGRAGELILVAGDSGSGKSTLLGLISGIIPEIVEGERKGCVFIGNKDSPPAHERGRCLAVVFQNPRSQFFTDNTTSELVFAMENYGLPREEMVERLEALEAEFAIGDLLDRDIFALSSGERQLLALMTALMLEPDILVFDEPSANLDYGNAMRMGRYMEGLRRKGKLVLVSDHRFFYLPRDVDRVYYVAQGSLLRCENVGEFAALPYAKRVWDLFGAAYPPGRARPMARKRVEWEGVSYRPVLEDISLSLGDGQITCLVGVNGAGKTTLARLLCGLLRKQGGGIRREGEALFLLQDADFQLFGHSVLAELEIESRDGEANRRALEAMGLWDLRHRHPHSLSGGEKQRLQLALASVSRAPILVFDEPTSGLDSHSMERTCSLLESLREKKTILVITHDYELVRRIGDRLLYLRCGRLAEDMLLEEGNIGRLNEIFIEMEAHYAK